VAADTLKNLLNISNSKCPCDNKKKQEDEGVYYDSGWGTRPEQDDFEYETVEVETGETTPFVDDDEDSDLDTNAAQAGSCCSSNQTLASALTSPDGRFVFNFYR
jgi:hypothetical protein